MLPGRLGRGTVTDDTHMTLSLAEVLAETPGNLDQNLLARRFAERFDPARGYGGNTRLLLSEIRSGEDWREALVNLRLPGGSWANGAAMRVAPVALAFCRDAGAVLDVAGRQAEVTGHDHPVGRDGARLQALAVLRALEASLPLDPAAFLDALEPLDEPWQPEFQEALRWIRGNLGAEPEAAVRQLGTSGRASHSVPASLWAFLTAPESVSRSLIKAVNLGGDTDTIGAMAGALAGALHGWEAFPREWTEVVEDGPDGKTALLRAADRLHGLA